MNKKYNKGFTLIELLVVIAIIGILSGVIIVNLGSESDKAKNARIKAGMSQIRTRVESMRAEDSSLSYPTAASINGDAQIDKINDDIGLQLGLITSVPTSTVFIRPFSSSSKYCVEVSLKGGGEWCVDSSGYAGTTAVCEGTNFDCK